MVVDAVECEPVSTQYSLVTGRNSGNFRNFALLLAAFAANSPNKPGVHSWDTIFKSRDIFAGEQRTYLPEQGRELVFKAGLDKSAGKRCVA
jgi:hypothetical protein